MGIKSGKGETGGARGEGEESETRSSSAGVGWFFDGVRPRRKIVKAARPTNLYNVSRFLSPGAPREH